MRNILMSRGALVPSTESQPEASVCNEWDEDVTANMSLMWMWVCVQGAAGAADGLREAVHLTEQQCQLPGALQHPATGQQPDQVSGFSFQ